MMVLATEGPESDTRRLIGIVAERPGAPLSVWQYTPATTIRLVIIPFGDAYYSAHDLPRLLCIHPDTESTSKVQVPWFLLKMIVPRSQGQNIFARTSFTALHYGLCVQMWKKARSCGCPRWPTAPDAVVSPSLTSPSCTT